MGQVYTQSLDGQMQNLGMYRLQQYDKNRLGMHWQIHKDASHFFDQYQRAGKKMPVTVAIGGDPLYIWCGQAPMPHGMFEMLLYGFVRNQNAQLVKSITNDIYIPRDVDIVIEGFVDPELMEIEGPFGDHTGYYTLKEPYPVMEVTAITMKENPVYHALVPSFEEHKVLMGFAREPLIFKEVSKVCKCIDLPLTDGGMTWLNCAVSIEKKNDSEPKKVVEAVKSVENVKEVKVSVKVNEKPYGTVEYKNLIPNVKFPILIGSGKGGVGKSTSSALTAVAAAQAGKKVLLVSLDPAHNQSDIFESKLSDKPRKIDKQLRVSELDLNKWVRLYLKGVEEQVRETYKYLTALNLEHYFKIIKYSPGIEEYALLMAYEHLTQKHNDMDYIVFDMPPTALTLRFFELPKISLLWLNQLLNLRNEILKKREIISTIKVGKKRYRAIKSLPA
jgi:hypothetical protein